MATRRKPAARTGSRATTSRTTTPRTTKAAPKAAPKTAAKAPARKAAPRAAQAAKKPAAVDVTQYADKAPTDYHKAFAKWIVTEVGYEPNDARSLRAAFLAGVSIAVAARPAFQESDFLAEFYEKNGITKRGPKPKDEAETQRRKTRQVVSDDEFEDDGDDDDEFDTDDEDGDEEDEFDEDDSDEDEDDADDEDEDEFDSDDEDEDDEDDEDEEEAPPARGRRRAPAAKAPARKPATTRGRPAAKKPAAKAAPSTKVRGKTVKDDDDEFLF